MVSSKIIRSHRIISKIRNSQSQEEDGTCNRVFRHIEKKDWKKVIQVISSETDELNDDKLTSEDFIFATKVLRAACGVHPPLEVIKQLADKFSSKIFNFKDSEGFYPLHIAAKSGASLEVVQFLVVNAPEVAKCQDNFGKFPLHWVCENYTRTCSMKKKSRKCLQKEMVKIVKILCQVAPSSVNMEDSEGMTAVEYALESDACLGVIRCVQSFCEEDWKRRKTEGRKHEDIEKCLRAETERRRIKKEGKISLDQLEMKQRRQNLSSTSKGVNCHSIVSRGA